MSAGSSIPSVSTAGAAAPRRASICAALIPRASASPSRMRCASERVAANWTAEHFGEFGYYHDGYGRLQIFDGSPENDGRLAGKTPRPSYAYSVAFNPDGTVASVQRGDRTVALATFDYETNTSAGARLTLPRISRPEDLTGIRSGLDRLFATADGSPLR